MIGLFDGTPTVCPGCGREIKLSQVNRDEYYAGVAMVCRCGFSYAYVSRSTLLAAVDSQVARDLNG